MGDVVPLIRHNVLANRHVLASSGGQAEAKELLWGTDVRTTFPKGCFDVIVGSDLSAWAKWDGPLLLATMMQLVTEDTQIIFSHTHRPNQLQRWREVFESHFVLKIFPPDETAAVVGDADSEAEDSCLPT